MYDFLREYDAMTEKLEAMENKVKGTFKDYWDGIHTIN